MLPISSSSSDRRNKGLKAKLSASAPQFSGRHLDTKNEHFLRLQQMPRMILRLLCSSGESPCFHFKHNGLSHQQPWPASTWLRNRELLTGSILPEQILCFLPRPKHHSTCSSDSPLSAPPFSSPTLPNLSAVLHYG